MHACPVSKMSPRCSRLSDPSSSRIAPHDRRRTQVHVPLRRRQVLVAGEFLNRPRRRAAHRQVRTERVPQDVNALASRAPAARRVAPGLHDLLRQRRAVALAEHPRSAQMPMPPQRRRQPDRHRHVAHASASSWPSPGPSSRTARHTAAACRGRRRSIRAPSSRRTVDPPRRPRARRGRLAARSLAASTSRSYSSKSWNPAEVGGVRSAGPTSSEWLRMRRAGAA